MFHALPVSAAAGGTFTVTDRTEVRARMPDIVTNAPLALDLDTRIDARATLSSHNAEYMLAYQPSLTLLDMNAGGIQPAVLNGLVASAEWRSHRTSVMVTERGTYGQMAFESLSGLPAPGTPTAPTTTPGTPVPLPSQTVIAPVQSYTFGSSETAVTSTVMLRPWTLTTRVGYQLSGGINESVIPFQNGPFGYFIGEYRLGSRDNLDTVVSAAEASFSTGTENLLVSAEEQWRHRWARLTDTMLSAGAYGARIRTATDAPYQTNGNPEAAAAIDQRFQRGASQTELRAEVRVAPIINPLTGLVDNRVMGTVWAGWNYRRIGFRGYVTASESLQQDTAIASKVVAGELDASFRATEAITFDAGGRAVFQDQNTQAVSPDPTQPAPIVSNTFNQTVVFFAVTVRAVKARF